MMSADFVIFIHLIVFQHSQLNLLPLVLILLGGGVEKRGRKRREEGDERGGGKEEGRGGGKGEGRKKRNENKFKDANSPSTYLPSPHAVAYLPSVS